MGKTEEDEEEEEPLVSGSGILQVGGVVSSPRPLGEEEMEATKARARLALLQLRSQSVQCTKHGPSALIHVHTRPPVTTSRAGASQVKPRVEVRGNEELVSRLLQDYTQSREYLLKKRQEDAHQHLEKCVGTLHRTYNSIRAEADEWASKRRQLELDVAGAQSKLEARKEEQDKLVTKSETLHRTLAALEEGNREKQLYLPTLQHLQSRVQRDAYGLEVRIGEIAASIKVLKDCQEEALSHSKIILKETRGVLKHRRNLATSLEQTEKMYFDKLDERRDMITKMDALGDYFAAREQQRDEIRATMHHSKLPKRLSTLQRRLQKQEMTNITSIMAIKGQNSRNNMQQLGDHQYTPRDIQNIFKRIEEKGGVKIITPQEMLDWAYSNREIGRNIATEEAESQERLRELNKTKASLTEQLTLLDQESGSSSVFLKRSAYEELHSKILHEKQHKQDATARICEKRSTLASCLVSIEGLCEKLGSISLHEDWVHKLDTTLLLDSAAPGKGGAISAGGEAGAGGAASASAAAGSSGAGAGAGASGSAATALALSAASRARSNLTREHVRDTAAEREALAAARDKLVQIKRLCDLGMEIGLIKAGGIATNALSTAGKPGTSLNDSEAASPASLAARRSPEADDAAAFARRPSFVNSQLMNRLRLNLLEISVPDETTNVRVPPSELLAEMRLEEDLERRRAEQRRLAQASVAGQAQREQLAKRAHAADAAKALAMAPLLAATDESEAASAGSTQIDPTAEAAPPATGGAGLGSLGGSLGGGGGERVPELPERTKRHPLKSRLGTGISLARLDFKRDGSEQGELDEQRKSMKASAGKAVRRHLHHQERARAEREAADNRPPP